jgi:hypothetical protein
MTLPLDDDIVDAIVTHMNDDHRADSLLICRALGGRCDATSAWVDRLDVDGIVFGVHTPVGTDELCVPWAAPIAERRQVREEVVQMVERARVHESDEHGNTGERTGE